MKILFVCLGNICRSPMAEAIFDHKINKAGLQNKISCDSCGTATYHVNHRPDHRTLKVLKQHGIETPHLGRQFTENDFHGFDLIFAMDMDNMSDILRLAKSDEQIAKVKLMRIYDTEKYAKEVPDPYYGTYKDFEHVFEILDRCTENLLNEVRG